MRCNEPRPCGKPQGFQRHSDKGFGLVETVVYVALLGMVSVFIINSSMQIVNLYARARAERETLANARAALEIIMKSVAQSQEVYAPTSQFNKDTGQLSLVTAATSTPMHVTAYIDFWVDGGRAMMRVEGEQALPLSAGSVKVSALRFEQIAQTLGRTAVKMTIRVDSASAKFPASVTLSASAAIRGNY